MLKRLFANLGWRKVASAQRAALAQAKASYARRDLATAENLCCALLHDDPANDGAHNILGAIALARGDAQGAVAHFERAVSLDPENEDYHSNCGEANRRAGKLGRAIACCETALRINPVCHAAWLNLAHAQNQLGRLRGAIVAFRKALELKPAPEIHSTLLMIMNSCPGIAPEEMLAEHRRWEDLYGVPERPNRPHDNLADPEKPLRIGYVHGIFARCFIEPVVSSRNRDRFRVYIYDNGVQDRGADLDEDARCLRELADAWRAIGGLSDDEAAETIRRDGIDILVDLAGHSRGYRLQLFAQKPAPVQATYLGYLNTTGMRSIDYRITDGRADPPGVADAYYVERLARLPISQWCYRPPQEMPDPGPLPALAHGRVTFGSFNNFHKINDAVCELWARLLIEVPGSMLLVLGAPARESAERLLGAFTAHGIPADRVTIRRQSEYADYLRAYREVDIALDPFPYNGGTTTCESLWMGLPVITLAGQYGPARSGVSLLSAAGLGECIAQDPEEYLAIARRLCADSPQLGRLRAAMRERMRRSPLMDADGFTRALESIYRDMWRSWCAQTRSNC